MADFKRLNAWLDTIEIDDKSVWPIPRDLTLARMKVDANNGNRDAVESLKVVAQAYIELLATTETRRRKIVRTMMQAKASKRINGGE